MKEHIHMMGICGTAMGSLAGLLQTIGFRVTGSDQNVYPPMSTRLEALGIKIMTGYKPENLTPRPDRVIVGNVMTRKHSEVQALLTTDIPYTSLPKAMGEFVIKDRHSVVISGTHGKTTTTALASWVWTVAGLKPGFMVGGVPLNFPETFDLGEGNYFVIEGDEYDTAFFDKVPKFIHYKPKSVILTSIEFDHADIYKDLDDVKAAFIKLYELIPSDGFLIYNADDENICSLLEHCKAKKIGYGVKKGDYRLGDIRWGEKVSEFDVLQYGPGGVSKKWATLKSTMFGEYNLLNQLAVAILASEHKIPIHKINEAGETFKGVKRRQEIIAQKNNITVIDDFAHHPTAVQVTIDGVKKRFPKSKIIGVFEPRSATSRRKIFQADFTKALLHADQIILSSPYDQTNIQEGDRFSSEELVNDCNAERKNSAVLGQNIDEVVSHIKHLAKSGDVVLLMSNGGFGGIYERLKTEL